MSNVEDMDLAIATQGDVPEQAKEYARGKIARLAGYARDPILHGQVRLVLEPNPARERPAVAEATLDVNGTPVRAQVAARDVDEAIDLLEERLGRRLKRHEERVHRTGQDRHRTGFATDHEWRHGDLPTQRPEWFDRPPDEREIVRKKTFALDPLTLDEAVFDLDMLGHDFYLFTEIGTGADAVVAYDHDHGIELFRPEGVEGDTAPSSAGIARVVPAPRLSIEESVERLDNGGERFVFFLDNDSGRGHIVYHRYDGHYGLIVPA